MGNQRRKKDEIAQRHSKSGPRNSKIEEPAPNKQETVQFKDLSSDDEDDYVDVTNEVIQRRRIPCFNILSEKYNQTNTTMIYHNTISQEISVEANLCFEF